MNRLTHERCSGIKTGYWSAAKKEELVQRLAAYENTGMDPEQIEAMKGHNTALIEQLSEKENALDLVLRDRSPRWTNPRQELPVPGEVCLVIASGKAEHILLNRAHTIAEYDRDEGWILNEYPEIDYPKIHCWMSLPEPPEED